MGPQCWRFQPQPLPDLSVGGLWLAFQSTVLQHTGPGVESNSLPSLLCAPIPGFLPFPHPPTQLFPEEGGRHLSAHSLSGRDDPPGQSLQALQCSCPSVSPRPALPTPHRPVQPRFGNSLAEGSDRLLLYISARYLAHRLLTDCMTD